MTKWYVIFFKNTWFYLKWTKESGFGWYLREHVHDITEVLDSDEMAFVTFIDFITEIEKVILEAFGFGSFYKVSDTNTQSSKWYVLFGFGMLINSSNYFNYTNGYLDNVFCVIYFENMYEYPVLEEPDSIGHGSYRTMVEFQYKCYDKVYI